MHNHSPRSHDRHDGKHSSNHVAAHTPITSCLYYSPSPPNIPNYIYLCLRTHIFSSPLSDRQPLHSPPRQCPRSRVRRRHLHKLRHLQMYVTRQPSLYSFPEPRNSNQIPYAQGFPHPSSIPPTPNPACTRSLQPHKPIYQPCRQP